MFMLDSLAVVVMVFMGLRDDRKPAGVPHTSIFRMRDEPVAAGASGKHAAAGKRATSDHDFEQAEWGEADPGQGSRGATNKHFPESGQENWADWERAGRRAP